LYVNRTYYHGFNTKTNKNGVEHTASYKVGDHVFALPGSEEEDMYIAQIDGRGTYNRPLHIQNG
jgi:hypothetical protein